MALKFKDDTLFPGDHVFFHYVYANNAQPIPGKDGKTIVGRAATIGRCRCCKRFVSLKKVQLNYKQCYLCGYHVDFE